jgi:hypothetical protein
MSGLPVSFTITMVFVFTIIGFFAGRAVTNMTNKQKKDTKDGLPKNPATPSSPENPAPLADPLKYTELVRLWREKSSGSLYVETSGHLLASSGPLNPAQKNRFIELVKELAVWTGIPTAEVVPAAAEPASKPASSPVATVPNLVPPPIAKVDLPGGATPVKTDPLPPVPSIPVTPQTPPPPPPAIEYQPAVPPYAAAAPVPKTSVETAKKPAVSMVEQIDEILQELIQRSDNPGRRIKLMEERNQGVIVWVEQEHFSGIDAVTNDSARDLIRAAAKEWERRSETRL